ncbi:DUF58 domain-containing protein [Paraferrimonas sp. SM1919]|uniref:DUF58 domain-containing protein n=1 Tax=Paraferrimonas sp. SM1919 TaxID=2662263 RepID=UPI0013D6EBC2|nr:DUF58 domain-containing protein [Paraferrimonas sp. SM1919]
MENQALPRHSDGINLCEQELLANMQLANLLEPPKTKVKSARAGLFNTKIKGRGMEFAELRQYQAGDDVRSIDWKVTARTGRAHTKLFSEERERPVLLFCDLGLSSRFGSALMLQSVQIAHIASTLAAQAIKAGDRVGAVISSEHSHKEYKPRSRRSGLLGVVRGLLDVHNHGSNKLDSQYFDHALARLQQLAKPGSLIWLLSDGSKFNASHQQVLRNISQHCQVFIISVTDPIRDGTVALPTNIALPVFDGQQQRILDYKEYQIWLAKQQQSLAEADNLARFLNTRHIKLSAGTALAKQLGGPLV